MTAEKQPALIYLDNNATTRVAPEVAHAMRPWLEDGYGNPSSLYRLGREAAKAIAHAREQVAALVGSHPDEILFTSCGTESDNLALRTATDLAPHKKHLITTAVEHSAVRNPFRVLEKKSYSVSWLEVDRDGQLNIHALEAELTRGTALVSVMWANNETGMLFPVAEISEMCRSHKILFHTDAVQVAGKLPISAHKLGVDFLALAAHKFHGPKGVGVLYVRRGLLDKISPLIHGGGQEHGYRGGTENVAGIVGIGVAAELAVKNLHEEQTRVKKLRDQLEQEVGEKIERIRVNSSAEFPRLPNTTNLSFLGCEAEAILVHLDQHGICASSGSACTTGKTTPSHVLTALGLDPATARASLRFSFGLYNTERELAKTIAVLPGIIERLRQVGGVHS